METNITNITKPIQQSIANENESFFKTLTERQSLILQNNPIIKPWYAILNLGRDPQSTTPKFKKTDDLQVIEELNARNWYISDYIEQKRQKRNKHRVGFQKYRAIYLNDSHDLMMPEGHITIIQTGAHDGTTKQTLQLGFYRNVSLHHLVISGDVFKWSLKHYADDPEQLSKVLNVLKIKLPLVKLKIQNFYDTLLTTSQMEDFARRAINIRYKDKYEVDIQDVLKVQRPQDEGNRLWKVYNRVHENLLNPQYEVGVIKTEHSKKNTKVRKPKSPKGINFILNFNLQLWNLAEEYKLQ